MGRRAGLNPRHYWPNRRAVFPQEIVPGPVILANNGATDCCQTDPGQTVTENN